jgi:hypothetical protein
MSLCGWVEGVGSGTTASVAAAWTVAVGCDTGVEVLYRATLAQKLDIVGAGCGPPVKPIDAGGVEVAT